MAVLRTRLPPVSILVKAAQRAILGSLVVFPTWHKLYSKIHYIAKHFKKEGLTDKYDILRGINRGANHDVIDVTNKVYVYSGREFWAWLNYGEQETQEWILTGIIDALKEEKIHQTASALLKEFTDGVVAKYENDIRDGNTLDWYKFLNKING